MPALRANNYLENLKYLDVMITLNTVLSYQITWNILN